MACLSRQPYGARALAYAALDYAVIAAQATAPVANPEASSEDAGEPMEAFEVVEDCEGLGRATEERRLAFERAGEADRACLALRELLLVQAGETGGWCFTIPFLLCVEAQKVLLNQGFYV